MILRSESHQRQGHIKVRDVSRSGSHQKHGRINRWWANRQKGKLKDGKY